MRRRSPKLATRSSSPRKSDAECPKPISGQLHHQNLLPHLKFFCKNAFHRKATPFLGQKPFLDRFLGEGA